MVDDLQEAVNSWICPHIKLTELSSTSTDENHNTEVLKDIPIIDTRISQIGNLVVDFPNEKYTGSDMLICLCMPKHV